MDSVRKALDMRQIQSWAKQMTVNHALFVFDSCFAGTVFESKSVRRRPAVRLTQETAKPVRYFITAGGAGEELPGKSLFTPLFALPTVE